MGMTTVAERRGRLACCSPIDCTRSHSIAFEAMRPRDSTRRARGSARRSTVREVAAEDSRAHGLLMMTTELGQLGRDATQRIAQTFLHRCACALGRSADATLATAEADGCGELLGQSLDLGLDRVGAREVGDRLRIVELVA